MKKVSFQILSDVKCKIRGCPTYLKQNLVDRKPTADLCYPHHQKIVKKNPLYNHIK